MNFINMNFLLSLNLNIFNRKVISDKPENKYFISDFGFQSQIFATTIATVSVCQILFQMHYSHEFTESSWHHDEIDTIIIPTLPMKKQSYWGAQKLAHDHKDNT